jgi:hypothetical protein
VIVFDPSVPIPQRADARREAGVAPNQVTTEAARAAADAHRFEVDAVRLDALAPSEPKALVKDDEAMEVMADVLEAEAAKAEASVSFKPE